MQRSHDNKFTTPAMLALAIGLMSGLAAPAAFAEGTAATPAFGTGFATQIGNIRAAFRKAENICKAQKSRLHDQFLDYFVKPKRDRFEEAAAAGPEALDKFSLESDIQVRFQSLDGKISEAKPLKLRLKADGSRVTGYEIIDPSTSDPNKATVPEELVIEAYIDPDCKRPVSLGQVVEQTIASSKVEKTKDLLKAEADQDIRRLLRTVSDTNSLSLTNPPRSVASPVEAASRNLKDPDALDDAGGAVESVAGSGAEAGSGDDSAPSKKASTAGSTGDDAKPAL